jgi:alanyl-tRNA synthetase
MSQSTAQIRRAFLDYFVSQGHQEVASSSLVPADDPTLLFTNAGMNQFKEVFLGGERRDYVRAVTSQRCVRAGGKHNDLENVGYTARHHTFFEMLGNFSFGDYFKADAIRFAWQFLTEKLQLPADKLLVTIYAEDDEAHDIWVNQIGIPQEKIIRIATSDNFWSMGETGPCGPCSEIFYDHGEHIWGGPPGSPEEDGDRFIEIWNLVFMQYNRLADGTMQPLPKPSIDTGMGLERISAILQNVHSNYETDIFQNLIQSTATTLGCTDLSAQSLRVIADHIRSCGFLICDGVLPSNEGRGYVLRRIIRRAVRHGYKLGASETFFYKLVAALVSEMGDAYPEIVKQQSMVEQTLKREEEQFARTLERGMHILDDALAELEGEVIPGDLVFKLYDTYGFPVDLVSDVAREKGVSVDQAGFEKAMEQQRQRAQQASKFAADYNASLQTDNQSEFTGYEQSDGRAQIIEILKQGGSVESVSVGDTAIVLLDKTPFYAESGGQVGDKGILTKVNDENLSQPCFAVSDTQKLGEAVAHHGTVTGDFKVGDVVLAKIDGERRDKIRANHSATHLLHAALRKVLGEHVMQKGSLVDADKLRFDFSHPEAVTHDQLCEIEQIVNEQVRANYAANTQMMELEAAKASGAMALFGEKYDDQVRVVTMGTSTELCGGTHVNATGDIGMFKLISEGGIASGVRRIEAVTASKAVLHVQHAEAQIHSAARMLKTDTQQLATKVTSLLDHNKGLEKELSQLKQKLASQAGNDLMSSAVDIKGVKLLCTRVSGIESKALRPLMDELKQKIGSGALLLALASNEKVNLIAGVTRDLTQTIKAGELVNFVASQVGGKGGGRPDMAQAGGSEPENLDKALASVASWLEAKIALNH